MKNKIEKKKIIADQNCHSDLYLGWSLARDAHRTDADALT